MFQSSSHPLTKDTRHATQPKYAKNMQKNPQNPAHREKRYLKKPAGKFTYRFTKWIIF